ncbi:MAG: AmmeMemoRadiSam system protein B, partial [Candidatus Aminicenantes bacterium]|nr:AmmeMemoRadiSam system protein B [Candidatus Aminicenantes bacterium]
MKKLSLVGLLLCLFAAAGAAGQDLRRPAVDGVFYEKDPGRLAASLKRLLDAVDPRPIEGEVLALVAPHAAYACSGPTAALAYRQVGDRRYDAVVIIGPSHHVGFEGCSIYPRGGYETPLGVAAVDEALAAELGRRTGFGFTPEAHVREHSVEVQVPFVQTVLPGVPIVPVVMGFADRRAVRTLAEGLTAARAGRKILVVASTDLSHHLPRGRAARVDAETVGLIKAGNVAALFRKYERQGNVFCGGGAVLAALLYAQ